MESTRLPREMFERYRLAHKFSMDDNACVTSSVAFTHKSDDDTWSSGLYRETKVYGVKEGAAQIARRYGESVEFKEFKLDKSSDDVVDFLNNHKKIWILVYRRNLNLIAHMFSAVQAKKRNQFFVWDTSHQGNFSVLSAGEIKERIVSYHQDSGPYYMFGFNNSNL